MFFIKKVKKAYTLIELMIAVTIVATIIIGINNTSFIKITEQQRIGLFTNKILTNIETIRNNTLMGKGVDSNQKTIYQTEITLTTSGSGGLQIRYKTGALSLYINSKYDIIPKNYYSINKIECLKIDNSIDTLTSSGVIIIKGVNFTLSGCNPTSRKLKVTTKYKEYEESFTINIVNGLIVKNKGNSL